MYNHSCAAGADRPDGFAIADLLLSEGRDLTLCATDYAAFSEPDHFGGWVMVRTTENTPEALLVALKAGNYYSSQGPELRGIEITHDAMRVQCSAMVTVIVQGAGSAAIASHGASMTQACLSVARFRTSSWLRVTIIDASGRRAWSNPIRNRQR